MHWGDVKQANNKWNMKTSQLVLCDVAGERRIPLTYGQKLRERFHIMTSLMNEWYASRRKFQLLYFHSNGMESRETLKLDI